MTELQFIDQLQTELANPLHWPNIRSVTSSKTDRTLAPNELLVTPATKLGDDPVVLRVTVECLLPAAD